MRFIFLVMISFFAWNASAQDYDIELVGSGFDRPLYVTSPPGDSRVFVLEQHTGEIKILDPDTGTVLPDPFLDLPVSAGGEQGLLGLAFSPSYDVDGFFYVSYTDTGGTSQIVRYTVSGDPDEADAGSALPILSVSQPQANHNGGWIGFGPDGYLYVALGDGGGSDDNDFGHTAGTGNAQDATDNLLGKILRLEPDGDPAPDNPFVGVTGDDEIWVYGLRNPWRPSFDRMTGDLYIADVGQNTCEEISVQSISSSGGENYGWRLREGTIATPSGGVGGAAPGAIDPIFDYPHSAGGCSDPPAGFTGISVTGGYVYRGLSADLWGLYLFADYLTAEIWALRWDGSTSYTDLQTIPDQGADLDLISSFGEDSAGNVYITDIGDGEVYRILPEPGGTFLLGALLLLVLSPRRKSCVIESRSSRSSL